MKLMIPAALERKLNAYVQSVDAEIAGMGAIEVREDGNFWVTDIAIYDQEVTGGTADLSPQALAHFQTELIKNGISPRNWYLWWHSHNTMSAFFSTTDTGTIASSDEFDHVLSLVVNKKRERKARFDVHRANGIPMRLTKEHIDIEIAPEVNPATMAIDEQLFALKERAEELIAEKRAIEVAMPEGIEEEVAAKVRIKSYKQPAGFQGHGHSQGDGKFLQLPFNENWSKNRKKNGGVTTPGQIIRKGLDLDEVELLLEETQTMIRAHEANGNADTVECEELRADLKTYQEYLGFLEGEAGDGYADDDLYWNGKEWVDAKELGYGNPGTLDFEDDLPPLPNGYKYGFNRDDERY